MIYWIREWDCIAKQMQMQSQIAFLGEGSHLPSFCSVCNYDDFMEEQRHVFVYSFVVKRFVCLAVQGNTPLLVGKNTTIKNLSFFQLRRYFIQYDVMIFLIIWPLLIHSSQQPSNLRDNSTHVCRIFSLVIPCIFGLFVDNFHLVLQMKRSLS